MTARPLALLAAGALAAAGGLQTLGDDGGEAARAGPGLDGVSVFQAKGCAACHAGPEGTTVTGVGPSLADAPSWAGTRVEGMSADEYVRQSIVSPQSFTSPVAAGIVPMPTLAVSPEELDALVGYLLGDD